MLGRCSRQDRGGDVGETRWQLLIAAQLVFLFFVFLGGRSCPFVGLRHLNLFRRNHFDLVIIVLLVPSFYGFQIYVIVEVVFDRTSRCDAEAWSLLLLGTHLHLLAVDAKSRSAGIL